MIASTTGVYDTNLYLYPGNNDVIRKLAKSLFQLTGLEVRRIYGTPLGHSNISAIQRLCGDKPLCIADVGANVGNETRSLQNAFPSSTIHCFEPVRTTFAHLEEQFLHDPRIKLNRQAVGSSVGSVNMSQVPLSTTNSIVDANSDSNFWEPVPTTTLDHYIQTHGISIFDYVKIDTEGHDLEVLKGSSDSLSQGKITLLQIEVTFSKENSFHTHFCDALELLSRYRYRFLGTPDSYCLADRPARKSWGDALFAHDSILRSYARHRSDWTQDD